MVYFIPDISTLLRLLLASIGVVIWKYRSLTWACMGIRIQSVYQQYYKIIIFILSLFLLYCTFDITLRGEFNVSI